MAKELVAILAWKPYSTLEATQQAIVALEAHPTIASHKYYLALPTRYLEQSAKQNTSEHLIFGATAMASVAPGSFTEAIAGKMLKQQGAQFVLVGTAYSRQYSDRDPVEIRQKILTAIDAGLVPFLCIGENMREFESGQSDEVMRSQLAASVKDFTEREWQVLKICYEAPWINAMSSMPSWDVVKKAYQRCVALVQEVCGVPLPVMCGVPDDLADLVPFVDQIKAEGYFFSHASFHLDIFSKGLHLAMPIAAAPEHIEEEKVETPEPKQVAEVLETAVLAAAHEVEEQEVQEVPEVQEMLEVLEEKDEFEEFSEEQEGENNKT